MKSIKFDIPIFDVNIVLIQVESPNDYEAVVEEIHDYEPSTDIYDELCDCISGDKFNGASTFWHSGNHTGIVVFYRMESDERKLVCYAHEKRHLEDHILEYLGIHDIETAGYLSGWLATKFSELYHAKTKKS